jgi:uncharacterized protein (DUF433 family)
MSRVLSLRLRDGQVERLGRVARRLGRTPSETGALLLEEALRMAEFGHITFRDSPVGRQAYVQGTSLAVWEVVMVAQAHDGDATMTASYLEWPVVQVQAALQYAAAYPDEIEAALADNDAYDFAKVSRMLPQAQLVLVPEADAGGVGLAGAARPERSE